MTTTAPAQPRKKRKKRRKIRTAYRLMVCPFCDHQATRWPRLRMSRANSRRQITCPSCRGPLD